MKIKIIDKNKKDFLDLLLLADEKEAMIDKYLERGILFALYDKDLKSICVVTDEGNGNFEIQNLATYEKFQGKGYACKLLNHVFKYYENLGSYMYVGTGDCPWIVQFYENRGFILSHHIENFILDNYDKPIFEGEIQLIDKVYFKKDLRQA